MCKKFAWWFVIFGLSFLVSNVFGWIEQGKAFLYIHLGIISVVAAIAIIIFIIVRIAGRFASAVKGISFLLVLATIGEIAIALFATWGATKLFDIDFYVVYQIMTFGQCLCCIQIKKGD